MTPVTTTNTKTVFQKAPFGAMKTLTFTVLATLLLSGGVMIGQIRPAVAQTGAGEDCNKISDQVQRTACWVKKIKAGEKYLVGADLRGLKPGEFSLYRVDLQKADLRQAYLNGANLREANLTGANLSQADLTGANLIQANLGKVELRQTNLTGANLSGANLTEANLTGAILPSASMRQTILTGAKLYYADLHGADMRWANLTGAHLAGANLTGAILTGAVLTGIQRDKDTKGLPPGN